MRIATLVTNLISFLVTSMAGHICLAGTAGFPTLPSMIEHEWKSHRVLSPAHLSHQGAASGYVLPKFNLHSFGDSVDQLNSIKTYLSSQGIHPLLTVMAKPSSADDQSRKIFGLSQESILAVKDYSFRAGRYEVCKANLRTISAPNGAVHIVGVAPVVDGVFPFSDDAWMQQDAAAESAVFEMSRHGFSIQSARVTSYARCLFPINNELVPAWKFLIRNGSVLYQVFVTANGIVDGGEMTFDVDAVVRAYDKGPADGTLKDFQISVNGDGTMTNEYFTTEDFAGAARMTSSTNEFTGAQTSSTFAEQSSFAHVNRHLGFVLESGYTWQGPKPLTVKTHVKFANGNINNAQYTPFDGQSGPFILIADGDGSVLQNLPYDSDVVSHEFGHHVVFSSITQTSGESLILHEGLADAIAFMRTGDACLGESICPSVSTLCQVKSQCLRTGDNAIKYNDETYSRLGKAHLQGQLVSGFFWDLKKGGSIPSTDLNKLLIGMIPYLPSDATIKTMLIALLDADFALYNSQYQSVIVSAADARGMSLSSLGISMSEVDGKANGATTASTEGKSGGGSGLLGGMCSVGAQAAGTGSAAWIVLVMMIPILVQAIRKKPVPVKVKKT